MSTDTHTPAYLDGVDERQARIAASARAIHGLAIAMTANGGALDHPAAIASTGWTDTGGTVSLPYVRTPSARYLRIEARVSAVPIGTAATVRMKLTVRDDLSHSVAHTDDRCPAGFRDETHDCPATLSVVPRFDDSFAVVGYLDADELAVTLTDPSWSLDIEIAVSGGGTVDGIQLWEVPRFIVDDGVDGGGVIPGSFQRDYSIHDDTQRGLRRVVSTLEAGRLAQRTLLSLSWLQSTSATDTPSCTSTSYAPLTLLDAGSDPVRFVVPTRVVGRSTSPVPAQWRFLYRFDAGAGTETARVRLYGQAAGSPWTSGALAYSTGWTWSPWKDCAVRVSPASDALSLRALVSASGPSLWLAAVHVREALAPF